MSAEFELPADLLQLAFRWVHVLAAMLWVGFTYWIEWAWSARAGTRPEDEARRGSIELLSRTLFWLRWGALVAWLSGACLLMVLYYAGPYLLTTGVLPTVAEWGPGFLALFGLFLVYDLAFRWLGKRKLAELVLSLAWAAAVIAFGRWLESRGLSNRAIFAHLGALLGTTMAGNVWMRIWPCRRRALAALLAGGAALPDDLALAACRSRHNAYMSFPLVMLMVGTDQPGLTGSGADWPWLVGGLFAIGASLCWLVYAGLESLDHSSGRQG